MWRIPVGAEITSAIPDAAATERRGVYVMAHGAGGNMNDKAMIGAANALRRIGLDVVRFNFLYKEKGAGGPDRMPKLVDCFTAVVDRVREEYPRAPLYIGGRSMGGRAASMMAADGFDAAGLLLLAYPLHPPGQHDKLRDAHLPAITMPVLCFNGTRDTFCEPTLMMGVLNKAKTRWTMHWIEDADHGFHVPKKSGRSDADVLEEVAEATSAWLGTL
ncbi:MAG TPA: alpha/beta family hydrolase [Gemmatimonadaceae bacterium]|nr:alpha/beta family hydrolase [Gemmatimonadaceae bacterium]